MATIGKPAQPEARVRYRTKTSRSVRETVGAFADALPWRLRMLSREFLLVLGGVVLYFGGRGLTHSDPSVARSHGWDVVGLERTLGINWEPAIQRLIDGSDRLVTAANWVYIWGHWPVIVVTLVWLALRHPDQYRRTRNAMAISGAIGMVFFVLYPVAPPRLIGMGMVDTVTEHSQAYRVLQPPAFTNLYAAMPSLHVGWNLLMGIAIASVAGHWLLRAVGYALPAAMAAAVVLTANHYLLDVVAGASVALVGLAAAAWLERRLSGARTRRTGYSGTTTETAASTASARPASVAVSAAHQRTKDDADEDQPALVATRGTITQRGPQHPRSLWIIQPRIEE